MKLKSLAVAVALALGNAMQRRGFAVGALALSLDKAEHGKLPKDVQTLYVEKDGKFVLDLPEGVEEVKGLKSALEKERTAAKEAARQLKELQEQWGDLDPARIKNLMEKLGSDEEAQLIKSGKLDEVVERRMKKAAEAHKKELEKAQKAVEAAQATAKKYAQQVLDNHIRAAATKAGVHQHAVDDALFRARSMFSLDEEGNAVQLDSDGKVVLGKDNKSPFSPGEWMETMKESAPHWFPAGSSGSGAPGGKGSASGKTIKRAAFDALEPTERAKVGLQAHKGEVTIVD